MHHFALDAPKLILAGRSPSGHSGAMGEHLAYEGFTASGPHTTRFGLPVQTSADGRLVADLGGQRDGSRICIFLMPRRVGIVVREELRKDGLVPPIARFQHPDLAGTWWVMLADAEWQLTFADQACLDEAMVFHCCRNTVSLPAPDSNEWVVGLDERSALLPSRSTVATAVSVATARARKSNA